KIKDNKRLANILYEAKLRGIELVPATFASAAAKFSPDKLHPNKILCPLTSVKGVGGAGAELVVKAYEKYGKSILTMNRLELEELKVDKENKEVKAFGKKILDAFFGEDTHKEKEITPLGTSLKTIEQMYNERENEIIN
ncbi:MAG: hypothetical protein ACRCXX_14510, partial [Cetobacterium sp.]|uniref:hypothetical protein n=1 Tax=Cetobacterium sp. TaxID=2071632 RepID=UPI003F41AAC8